MSYFRFHMNDIFVFLFLTSLSMTISRMDLDVARTYMLLQIALSHSFLWLIFHCVCVYVCIYIYINIYHIFFIHSSVNGHLGCFHILAIVNSAAMNTEVHVAFWIRVFVFSRYMPKSGVAGSYGNSIFSFNFLIS